MISRILGFIVFMLFLCAVSGARAIPPADFTQTLHEASFVSGVGNLTRCTLKGDTCVAIADSILLLVALDDPYAPGPVIERALSGPGLDLALIGDQAFVVTGTGIDQFDLSDTQNPSLVGHFDTAQPLSAITAAGDLLGALRPDGLVVIISPSSHAIVGTITPPEPVLDLAGLGQSGDDASRYLYLGTDSGLLIYSLEIPTHPTPAATFIENHPGYTAPQGMVPRYSRLEIHGQGLAVTGQLIDLVWDSLFDDYIPGYAPAVFSLDLSAPASPVFDSWDLTAASGFFLGDGTGLITEYDSFWILTAPGWTRSAAWNLGGPTIADAAWGPGYLVLATGSAGLAVFDSRYPTQILPVAEYDGGPAKIGGDVAAKDAVGPACGSEKYGLSKVSFNNGSGGGYGYDWYLYSLADPLDPRIAADGSVINFAGGTVEAEIFQVSGDLVGMWEFDDAGGRMKFLDCSTEPPARATVFSEGAGGFVMIGDTLVLVRYWGDTYLVAYDASALPALPELSRTTLFGSYKLAGNSTLAFLYTSSEVIGLDLADPGSPGLGTPLTGIGYFSAWTYLDPEIAFLTSGNLVVADLSDVDNPAIVTSFPTAIAATGIFIDDGIAVLVGAGSLQVIDLGDPAHPVDLTGAVPAVGATGQGVWANGIFYLNCGERGIQAYDMSDPANPAVLGSAYGTSSFSPIFAGSDYLHTPGMVIPLHGAALSSVTGPESGPPAAADGLVLHLGPNPFNSGVQLSFDLATGGRIRILVHDLKGRQVGVLAESSFEPGPHTVTWNGRDSAGRPLPSGPYLFSIEQGSHFSVGKAILIK